MKILLIEDNRRFSHTVGECLQKCGHKVDYALSGETGVSSAISSPPDLIVLDYTLGTMSGFDVASVLNSTPITARIPFLLLSAMADDPELIHAFRGFPACKGILFKTRPISELLGIICRFPFAQGTGNKVQSAS